MINHLRITVLVENTAGARGLLAEHGLALWIEADGTNILFDTGQGMVLEPNAKVLGVDLTQSDAVVLSHGHYDHTGGLEGVLGDFARAAIYVHPCAFDAKFGRCADGTGRIVGSPIRDAEQLRAHVSRVVPTAEPTKVADGIWITGEIPRRNDFEDTGGPFFLDEACTKPDPLIDDQALYVESSKGTVVLSGCGHAGLVNTLETVSELTGGAPIHAVLGGFHLLNSSGNRIERSIAALQRYGVRHIGPAHCTGLPATARILATFPEGFIAVVAGAEITIP